MDSDVTVPPIDTESNWTRLRTWLIRSSDDRLIAGVAGGIAARIGINPVYVRAAFVVLMFCGGAGALLYAACWAVAAASVPTRHVSHEADQREKLGLVVLFLGVLVALRGLDLWFGDGVVWSVALVAFGIAAVWDRSGWSDAGTMTAADDEPGRVRILIGAVLMLAGLAIFSGTLDSMRNLGPVVLAVGITAAGFMLVFGPWVLRLAGDLAGERRDRIRSEERAEMAAHLHDSVLQTLALIQRTDDPRKMVTLARSQERELRGWLYGSRGGKETLLLSDALEDAAERVEQAHDVPVEVVVVKDVPVDQRIDAVVSAASEAMHNAARHSGAGRVSVYAEVEDGALDVFVSDHGGGFDPDEVPDDRHGIRQSIVGRMRRHGGAVDIQSERGEGTEVHLTMPLEPA